MRLHINDTSNKQENTTVL